MGQAGRVIEMSVASVLHTLLSALMGSAVALVVVIMLGSSNTGLQQVPQHAAHIVRPIDHVPSSMHVQPDPASSPPASLAAVQQPAPACPKCAECPKPVAEAPQKCVQLQPEDFKRSGGFYVHPTEGSFNALAKQSGTDKVTTHDYGILYSAALHLTPGLPKVNKLLEIGLGCDMVYGPGASAKLWRDLLAPAAEVWFAEYNAECVKNTQGKMDDAKIKVVVGDQGKREDVERWVHETGGGFDMIVDDGGHLSHQQITSFMILFQHALKPGGIYVIEDLQFYKNTPEDPSTRDLLSDWMDVLVGWDMRNPEHTKHGNRHPPPPGLRMMWCMHEACAFIKCYDDDPRCDREGQVDPGLVTKWALSKPLTAGAATPAASGDGGVPFVP